MSRRVGAASGRHVSAATLNTQAALASVATALTLGLLKGWAAWTTHSIAMLGSLTDTALDLVASFVTLLGVRIAAQPADSHHRFGHGKAEALAALFQVSLISVAALAIIWRSLGRIDGGPAPTGLAAGVGVSVAAILVTFALLAWQRRVLRRTGSIAIRADSVHYQSDLLLNGAVIAALVLEAGLGVHGADAVLGIAIGLWLGWGAWRSAAAAIGQLMDKEWPLEQRRNFLEIAGRHPALKGMHDLRTRRSGDRDFAQLHVSMDPQMSLAAAHRVMDEVEGWLRAAFPHVDILIHPDPEGHIDRDPAAAMDARDVIADLQPEGEASAQAP